MGICLASHYDKRTAEPGPNIKAYSFEYVIMVLTDDGMRNELDKILIIKYIRLTFLSQ